MQVKANLSISENSDHSASFRSLITVTRVYIFGTAGETPSIDSVEKVLFGHNTNEWTAASCIHEGIIRPSAVDPKELD